MSSPAPSVPKVSSPRWSENRWQELLQQVEQLIANGGGALARQELRQKLPARVPRPLLLSFASLARRAGAADLSVRLLNPVVRPSHRAPKDASRAEQAEYAGALVKLGAVDEAIAILKPIDKRDLPQALLFEVFAHVNRWDYDQTIPLLGAYLRSEAITPYQRLVGKVNLLAAMVFERLHAEADRLIADLLEETSRGGHRLLHGNTLELAAENAILRKDWSEAEKFLHLGEAALSQADTFDAFLVRKWRAVLAVLRTQGDPGAVARLAEVRAEARDRKHWETLRDCDRFEAIGTRNEDLLLRVYFGTPHAAFRKRLFEDFGHTLGLPSTYVWELSAGGERRMSWDIGSGDIQLGDRAWHLDPHQLIHRLAAILSSDFYRPHRLVALHARLYPGEYYNPSSSPARVYQLLKRLRQWCEARRLPLRIEAQDGLYALAPEGKAHCQFLVTGPGHAPTKLEEKLAQLKLLRRDEEFSSRDVSRELGISDRTAVRLLAQAVSENRLERVGRSVSTRYRFAS